MFIFTLKHPQPTQTDFYYQMVNYYLTSHFKQFGINLKFKFSLVCISNEKDFFFMHRLPIKGNCTQNTLNSIQNNKTFFSLFFCYVNFVIKQTPGYTNTVKRNFSKTHACKYMYQTVTDLHQVFKKHRHKV